MGFTALGTAVSGMRAAQVGLSVTGHNMSNSEIYGYSRQRVVQKDFAYQNVGNSAYGALKVGLGTDWGAIQQIRNEYLDITYRTNVGRLSFYSTKVLTGIEIEYLMGEMQGSYNFQSVVNDMWNSIQELTAHPSGIETRDFFLATCQSFVTKANEVYNSLLEYQRNLDQQVRDCVDEINKLVSEVKNLNQLITANEASGDSANDYRDFRNNALDRLSELIPMEYYYDYQGNVCIMTNGVSLLTAGNYQSYFTLRYCNSNYNFVEPVIGHQPGIILGSDVPPTEFQQWINYNKPINAEKNNDYGILNGLIISRGSGPAFHMGVDGLGPEPKPPNVADYPGGVSDPDFIKDHRKYLAQKHNYDLGVWSIENCMIPQTMMKLDEIVNAMVRMINDTLAPAIEEPPGSGIWIPDPNGPYDNNGNQTYVEVFSRINMERWDNSFNPPRLIPETPGDYFSQYSIGNIMINPMLLDREGGYNFLALSGSDVDIDDTSVLTRLQEIWQRNTGPYSIKIGGNSYNIQTAYVNFVNHIGIDIHEAKGYVASQTILVDQADNKRQSIMGVSMDEEMNNMMKYQYAYQSAARIFNVIDSMIDTIVNRMGRVGL